VSVSGELRAKSLILAFPAGAGPDFVNAAIAFEADITPRDLLVKCHTIEEDAQRKRIKRWGADRH